MAVYLALVRKVPELNQVELVVYRDHDLIHVEDGDEFVTIETQIDLFE